MTTNQMRHLTEIGQFFNLILKNAGAQEIEILRQKIENHNIKDDENTIFYNFY
jgi:hypothetical protein